MLLISSATNPKFKSLLDLEKSKSRKQHGLALVEGEKEIEMALAGGYVFQSVYVVQKLHDPRLLDLIKEKNIDLQVYELTQDLFSKLSYRETTGGIVAVVKTQLHSIADLSVKENGLYLVVEGVEKPGNLGAILRTADASGVDGVICCNLPSDIYNPNVIRSSLGTVFTVDIAVSSNQEAIEWLKNNKITVFCTDLKGAENYHLKDFTKASAIVVGTEATGVSKEWIDSTDNIIKIPMLGKIDSMNVSVASAILLFEAKRQRGFSPLL